MGTTYSTRRLYNAVIVTRDDLPGVGVLDIMLGLCLAARVDGNTIRPIHLRRDPLGCVLVFPSPAAAWAFLSDERNRMEWDEEATS